MQLLYKRHNDEDRDVRLSDADREKKRDIIQYCKSSLEANPNDMSMIHKLYHSQSDSRLPYCILRKTCLNKDHWLVVPKRCTESKELKIAAWKYAKKYVNAESTENWKMQTCPTKGLRVNSAHVALVSTTLLETYLKLMRIPPKKPNLMGNTHLKVHPNHMTRWCHQE